MTLSTLHRKVLTLSTLIALTYSIAYSQNIKTTAGTGINDCTGDGGAAISAATGGISGIVTDVLGNIYFTDMDYHVVRRINTSGIITRIAGSASFTPAYSGDGGPAVSAELNYPNSIAINSSGELLIADQENHRIRKISTTGTITTIAGNGFPSFFGEGVAATIAQFGSPSALHMAATGDYYFYDAYNLRIRKVNTSGIISTVAGNGTVGTGAEGVMATSTPISSVSSIVTDASGNIYYTEQLNHRVRKISTSGIVTTIVGTGTAGYTGDGGMANAATLNRPVGLVIDGGGNLYISEWMNHTIRKVTPAGTISTICGNGTPAFAGDGGPAISAQLRVPQAMALTSTGDLLIADYGNFRLRRIVQKPVASFSASTTTSCQDSCITLTCTTPGDVDSVRWMLGGFVIPPTGKTVPVCFGTDGIFDISVIVYNVSGADTSDMTEITVHPAPVATLTYAGGIFSTAVGFATYQWYKDGSPIPGATNNTWATTEPGTYYVKVTDANGCGAITASQTVSVQDVATRHRFMTVYPTPGNGLCTIETTTTIAGAQVLYVSVLNTIGQTIARHNIALSGGRCRQQMDWQHLPDGNYLIVAETNDGQKQTMRLSIAH